MIKTGTYTQGRGSSVTSTHFRNTMYATANKIERTLNWECNSAKQRKCPCSKECGNVLLSDVWIQGGHVCLPTTHPVCLSYGKAAVLNRYLGSSNVRGRFVPLLRIKQTNKQKNTEAPIQFLLLICLEVTSAVNMANWLGSCTSMGWTSMCPALTIYWQTQWQNSPALLGNHTLSQSEPCMLLLLYIYPMSILHNSFYPPLQCLKLTS